MIRSNSFSSRRRFLASTIPAAALVGAITATSDASPSGYAARRLDAAVSRLVAALEREAAAGERYMRATGKAEQERIAHDAALDAVQAAEAEVFHAARSVTTTPLPVALLTATALVVIVLRDESATPEEVDAEDPSEWRVELLPLVAIAKAR
jgi:hypothetical protein